MNILHVTPHLGGGIGTVLMDWLKKEKNQSHTVFSLDFINEKAKKSGLAFLLGSGFLSIQKADIVIVHYWHHPMLKEFLSRPLPPCRLIFWCHNNSPYSQAELDYPDLWLDTSPVQGHGRHIWSTGDISRFLEIKPKGHSGFNIGYVGTIDYKKMHPEIIPMCKEILKAIPEARFTLVGENHITMGMEYPHFHFTGKVDDVAPYLAEFDCFFYPLRPDHYGTCEQSLGESMAAGVVPVVMRNAAEKEIVISYVTGLIAENKNECVQFVKYLYDHPVERELMSFSARVDARKIYSLDRMISEWNAVFEEVIKMPKRERRPLCISNQVP